MLWKSGIVLYRIRGILSYLVNIYTNASMMMALIQVMSMMPLPQVKAMSNLSLRISLLQYSGSFSKLKLGGERMEGERRKTNLIFAE